MELVTGSDFIELAFLAAGIAMGFGAVGPGIGEGFVGGKPVKPLGSVQMNSFNYQNHDHWSGHF